MLLNLGTTLGMNKKWTEAKSAINRYLEDDHIPAYEAYATFALSMIERGTGDREQADQLMEKAKAIDPHVWRTVMPPPEDLFTPL